MSVLLPDMKSRYPLSAQIVNILQFSDVIKTLAINVKIGGRVKKGIKFREITNFLF